MNNDKTSSTRWSLYLPLLLPFFLSACGGGGGLNSDTTAPAVSSTSPVNYATAADSNNSRSFYMGFTPFQHSWIEDTLAETYQQIHQHGDLILHHLDDGVPWVEAYNDTPFHENVEGDLAFRLQNSKPSQRIFVATTAIDFNRKELAGYWGSGKSMKRPKHWRDKTFDDPEVIKAYINYCRRLIKHFKPSYFAYGIEVNLLAYNNQDSYKRFIKFAQQVYPALKKEFPDLPIFLSFYLEPPERLEETRKHITPLLPYTDIFAISTYPYMARESPPQRFENIPKNWFEQVRQIAPGKPFAVAETGFIAEDLSVYWKTFKGTPEDQAKYVKWMLSEANRLDAQFVVWFVITDYDELWTVLKFIVMFDPLIKAWKDTGLYDGDLRPRPALGIWDQWLSKPVVNGGSKL